MVFSSRMIRLDCFESFANGGLCYVPNSFVKKDLLRTGRTVCLSTGRHTFLRLLS
jgi:hypothetical protein